MEEVRAAVGLIIRAKRAGAMLPVLETILGEFGRRAPIRALCGVCKGRDARHRVSCKVKT
jgi:hypothetical protein